MEGGGEGRWTVRSAQASDDEEGGATAMMVTAMILKSLLMTAKDQGKPHLLEYQLLSCLILILIIMDIDHRLQEGEGEGS